MIQNPHHRQTTETVPYGTDPAVVDAIRRYAAEVRLLIEYERESAAARRTARGRPPLEVIGDD